MTAPDSLAVLADLVSIAGRPVAFASWPAFRVYEARDAVKRAAAELSTARELLAALRACVAALEAAGADGEPGEMPSPALDEARLLLARLDG